MPDFPLLPEGFTYLTESSEGTLKIRIAEVRDEDGAMDCEVLEKQTLLDLFHHGHTASSALHCLKTDLLLKHGDDYFRVAADGHFVPSLSRVEKLYDYEFKREYGAMSGEDMFSDLENLLQNYCNKGDGGTAKFGCVDNEYFVAICSPVMARAHQKVIQTSELVLVDAAGGMDKQRHRVYFFISPTAAGGIPLGVIVSSSEQQCVFEAAVSCLKTCFPDDSFYGLKLACWQFTHKRCVVMFLKSGWNNDFPSLSQPTWTNSSST